MTELMPAKAGEMEFIMFTPKGVYAAMLTPYKSDKNINEKAIRDMVDFYIDSGVEGIFPVSNVGEFIFLDDDMKRQFVDIVVDQTAGRVKITPGINAVSPEKSIEFGRYCQNAGVDGVVVSAPYYFKYDQRMVCDALSKVAENLDLPVILYNIPMFANEISLQSISKLMEIENIVAIKESSGSMTNVIDIINLVKEKRPDFNVLVGWEEMLLSTLTAGGDGCMVASGGIMPELMTGIYKSFKEGDIEKAVLYQGLVAKVTVEMKKVFFPYGYKLGMEARGFDMGGFGMDIPDEIREDAKRQKIEIKRVIDDVLALL